jgi:hypothetical protein
METHDLYQRTERLGITDNFLAAYQRWDRAMGVVIDTFGAKQRAGRLNEPHGEADIAALDELRDSTAALRAMLRTVREPA